ncbi:MAG: signal peptidase I [Bacilli bacterium]|nr:signal peptidase I [Bacilli bacterium]MDE6141377.1 signal peptidase I [Bacilli bacterium]
MKNKKRWYKSVSNWVVIAACVILIPILIMNLSIMYQANKDKDTVPSVFGYKPFIVLSGSMETEIKRGDLIITKIVDAKTLKVDDVIAFRDEQGTVTTHRIIEIVERDGENYFMTKGDNNSSQDHNLVALSDVEGIYVTRIPSVGNMLSSLAEPTTIVIVVLAITVIFAISFMVSTKRGINQERLEFLEYKRQKELEENKEIISEEDNN